MTQLRLSGGCQCGAVRYRFEGTPRHVALCHCRMCQKATGSVAWAYFTAAKSELIWTRGRPTLYRSSAAAQRGYCQSCGTPLTFEPEDADSLDVGIATLDTPAVLEPSEQYWIGTRMPWFAGLATLPVVGAGDDLPEAEARRRSPYQHPDHDTADWPPRN